RERESDFPSPERREDFCRRERRGGQRSVKVSARAAACATTARTTPMGQIAVSLRAALPVPATAPSRGEAAGQRRARRKALARPASALAEDHHIRVARRPAAARLPGGAPHLGEHSVRIGGGE